MAIFVTEDDAQSGRDHVDAHRSVLMVISPYARRDYVSHSHTSIASILKTFDLTLHLAFSTSLTQPPPTSRISSPISRTSRLTTRCPAMCAFSIPPRCTSRDWT
jgi:hypothetical protein